MKINRPLVLLVVCIAFVLLIISLPAAKGTQAAPLSQSAEERIKATLEDAAASLGGFSWESDNTFAMARPPKKVGSYKDANGASNPVYLYERLAIWSGSYDFCQNAISISNNTWKPWTFHGMPGCLVRVEGYLDQGGHIWSVVWQPQGGLEFNGKGIVLMADSYTDYGCAGANAEDTAACGDWGQGSINALPLAEALHQAALKNGLYEPQPEASPEQPIVPVDPGEVVPAQPEVPTEQPVPADAGGLFGIPVAVILGSLGIPVAGAVAGGVVSSLISLLGSNPIPGNVNPAVIPATNQVNDQGLYWSERPWDIGGPGYVTKEEYERTKSFMDQGYKWTNGGWQAPDQIKESDRWQQNNRDAVEQEEAEWQAKRDVEQQALEQNEADLKKTADELQEAGTMLDLKDGLETINQDLQEKNIYVFNPYQGDPTLIAHGLVMTKNFVWDKSVGLVTGSNGLTCEGFVDQTYEGVKTIVHDRYGPGAKVESMKFAEKSTIDPRKEWLDPGKYKDFLDRIIDDNHNLIKVTLPDGSQWAVDFHQHNTGKKPPILRPWAEVEQEWKTYLGEHEFIQYSSKSG